MQNWDIVLLTEDRYYEPVSITPYIQNILDDDRLLMAALAAENFKVVRKSWSDPDFDWSTTKFCIFRTTWDYFDRFETFFNWFNATAKKTHFINSELLIRWNLDKHYLADLKAKNINIVETLFIEAGYDDSLNSLFINSGFDVAILKPAISGAARHTFKLNAENISQHEKIFHSLIANEAMLLQPFQQEIITTGEVAFMLMGGKFTHAVLKKAKPGDFRVQDDFGGTLHDYHPTPEEIQFSEQAIAACPEQPLYARVDMIRDNYGNLAIMELEIIEPELWLRRAPESAIALTKSIKNYINTI